MILTAAYFQFVRELEPCPLCISQRVLVLCAGLMMLAAAMHNPGRTGIRVYSILTALISIAGIGIAARHVWLQNLPADEVPSCGPGLEYVFKHFPLTETLKLLLNGTGECAEVLWTFMGLSIPAWTLVAFALLLMISFLPIFANPGTSPRH